MFDTILRRFILAVKLLDSRTKVSMALNSWRELCLA